MNPDEITWNFPAVDALASTVAQQAAHLRELHDDIKQRGAALSEYFLGKGATGFFDALNQHLQGLSNLADHIELHGNTIVNSAHGTAAMDATVQTFFV